MCSSTGVEMYFDEDTQSQRVRLDGYGANGPPEVLVNMMAVDPSIKVHFRTACMTCGKDISRASTENHFISGACCRKAESLASGGLVFCSYCEVTGAHWVQACPLLVSFCFACWVWGHSFLHHQVADENYLIRLMRRFNEMREWHHVNLRSNQKSRTIPSNSLVTSSSKQDSHIIYEGSYDEVLGIANGLPGSSSVPACWLMRGHWKEIFPSLSEPSFKWVASGQEELCLTKIDKMLKSDNSKLASQRSEAEKKIEESSKRNPYLPLPPPPLMPHPDEIGENEKEEDQEKNGKEANEEQDEKESKKQMVGQDFDSEEDHNEEEEFVDGNISDWLEY